MKKILITGVAGFIGFSLAKTLGSFKIYGIDNMNSYYDLNLKKDRLKVLNKNKNFEFHRLDIAKNIQKIDELFKQNKFDYIVHLAAQAGVRYSLKNPHAYLNSNIVGSVNLLETMKKHSFSGHSLIASTSSVYGLRDNSSFHETDKCDEQISLYASTKKSLESIAHSYSYNFGFKTSILRFFTVYGPWGRPDMALYKFTKAILENKPIDLFNAGELWRDFTYIDDLTISIKKLLNKFPQSKKPFPQDNISSTAPFRIINIGNQSLVKVIDLIKILEIELGIKPIIKNLPMQKGDVRFTLSNSNLLESITNYSPDTSIEIGVKKYCDWYLNYYKI